MSNKRITVVHLMRTINLGHFLHRRSILSPYMLCIHIWIPMLRVHISNINTIAIYMKISGKVHVWNFEI
jgi:hypothetical protein